jgi:hypothetical protein
MYSYSLRRGLGFVRKLEHRFSQITFVGTPNSFEIDIPSRYCGISRCDCSLNRRGILQTILQQNLCSISLCFLKAINDA